MKYVYYGKENNGIKIRAYMFLIQNLLSKSQMKSRNEKLFLGKLKISLYFVNTGNAVKRRIPQ